MHPADARRLRLFLSCPPPFNPILDGLGFFCIFLYMEKQVSWTIAAISEFAKAKALSVKQAFNYLSLFKGIDFLQTHYGAEHMLSFEDTVEDLTAICQRNGGEIR